MSNVVLGGSKFENLSQRELNKLLDYASSLGIREIDTSPYYGKSETMIGKYLAVNKNFKVSTKIGLPRRHPNSFSSEEMIRQVERSLDALNVERFETLFFHSLQANILDSTLQNRMLEFKKNGIIQNTGYSGDNENLRLVTSSRQFDAFMITFNALDVSDYEVIQALPGKIIYVKRPIARGVFKVNIEQSMKNALKKLAGISTKFYSGSYEERYRIMHGEPKYFNSSLKTFMQFVMSFTPSARHVYGVSSRDHLKEIIRINNLLRENQKEGQSDLTSEFNRIMDCTRQYGWKALS